MILIADSGATKANWCVMDSASEIKNFTSPGINAAMLTENDITRRIASEVMPEIGQYAEKIEHVYFYGAGCLPHICDTVDSAIKTCMPNADVEVNSDMLGACRALCGDKPGVACILGTGANSCLYDGKCIIDNIPPLGFILGDEGSGAYLGKMLVSDVLKRQLPDDLCRRFLERYDLNAAKVVQMVYREAAPSRFLASFAPFIKENITDFHIHRLVVKAFNTFFRRNVCAYRCHEGTQVHFCGSIAYYFYDVLIEAANISEIEVGTVLRDPMSGLKKYHSA